MLDALQLDTQALAKLKLNNQPFLPPEHCEDYFVNTALSMLINGVLQQLTNHDGIQVIKGEFGSGKTSFCHRLLCGVPAGLSIDLHRANASHTISTLLQTIAGLGESSIKAGTQELAVQAANRVFRRLYDQQQPVLLIDDAHLLTPKTLQTLFKFLSAIAKQNYGRLKLILVGERKIDETLAKIDPSLLSPDNIFSTLLRPLNRQDVENYIHFRLERADAIQKMPLTKKELTAIQSRCGGLPYKINRLTCEALNGRNGAFADGKPSRKLFLGCAALIIILAPIIFWLTGIRPPSPSSPSVTQSAEIRTAQETANATPRTDKGPAVIAGNPGDPSTDIVDDPANLESMAPNSYPDIGGAESSSDNMESTNESDAQLARDDDPVLYIPNKEFDIQRNALPRQAVTEVIEYPLSESWLAAQPQSYYMIQLAGTWNQEKLLEFSRQLQLDKTLVFHRSLRNNQEWYILLYGPFPDYAAAQNGISELPLEAKSNNPWARPVASLTKTLYKS